MNCLRSLAVVFLLVGLVHSQSGIGNRETGDQLIYVKYLEVESQTPENLLLHFSYDGRPRINRISAVQCFEQRDSNFFNLALLEGGAGNGQSFIKFSQEAVGATYLRTQCNFYGFYN